MSRMKRIKQQGLMHEDDILYELYDDVLRKDSDLEGMLNEPGSGSDRAFRQVYHSIARVTSKKNPLSIIKKGAAKSKTLVGK